MWPQHVVVTSYDHSRRVAGHCQPLGAVIPQKSYDIINASAHARLQSEPSMTPRSFKMALSVAAWGFRQRNQTP